MIAWSLIGRLIDRSDRLDHDQFYNFDRMIVDQSINFPIWSWSRRSITIIDRSDRHDHDQNWEIDRLIDDHPIEITKLIVIESITPISDRSDRHDHDQNSKLIGTIDDRRDHYTIRSAIKRSDRTRSFDEPWYLIIFIIICFSCWAAKKKN